NPDRRFAPAGDGQVTLAWDNLSEYTPDPKTGQFDFRGYRIWKVSNWTRPVGSSGPSEDDWTLLADYRWFNYAPDNSQIVNGVLTWPKVFIPQKGDFAEIRLHYGDLWDRQSGDIIRPNPSVLCVGYPNCVIDSALSLGTIHTETGRPN